MQKLDAVLAEAEREGDFSGVVLIDRSGEILCHRAFGHANKADSVPNLLNTRFGLASVTKLFTAAAVAQLVERGLVSFDKPVVEYLPNLSDTISGAVEVRHLLSHTSGIADYFDEETQPDEAYAELWNATPSYGMRTPSDFLPLFRGRPAYHDPGARFRYSNSGFIVLGLIIEAVTGNGYADHIAEQIFRNAGMENSGFFELDAVHPHVAIGYIPTTQEKEGEEPIWRTNQFSIPGRGGPDGGAYATAEDLQRFLIAMENSCLVGAKTRQELWQPKVRVDDEMSYGYGFWLLERVGEVRMIGGFGEDPGCSARAFCRAGSDGHLIVLSNHTAGAGTLFRKLRVILGESFG